MPEKERGHIRAARQRRAPNLTTIMKKLFSTHIRKAITIAVRHIDK